MRRLPLAAAAVLLLTGTVAAQSGVPDGAFVRDTSGETWLVLNGERLRVPIHPADDATIAAIPDSGRVLELPRQPPGAAPPPTEPTATAGPGTERVVMDAVFWALPGPVAETCIELPAGRLAVTVRLESEPPRQAASFLFAPHRQRDPDPDAEIRATVRRKPTTVEVPVAGGRYCYAILNHADVPASIGRGSPEPVGQAQDVAVRMVLTPQ